MAKEVGEAVGNEEGIKKWGGSSFSAWKNGARDASELLHFCV
jgi:hypothetical protein